MMPTELLVEGPNKNTCLVFVNELETKRNGVWRCVFLSHFSSRELYYRSKSVTRALASRSAVACLSGVARGKWQVIIFYDVARDWCV
jgi:hypothetical protein